ncbi:MAG: Acg family FMN-binding oxidoreductase [Geminicoccaceae bacterium]
MMTRRTFATGAAALGPMTTTACSSTSDGLTYDEAVQQTFRHADDFGVPGPAAYRELVHYATMSANSHNTQPWVFAIEGDQIRLSPDPDRRCPVVDPHDHHVFASLGCAAENIMIAADAFGLHGGLSFDEAASSITIALDRASRRTTPAFQAIPERQCTRAEFSGEAAPVDVLKQLETFASQAGIDLHLLTDDKQKLQIIEYVVAGNSAQMDEDAFVEELRSWIRFNEAEALATRDGLTYRSVGSPASPRWLGKLLFSMMFRKKTENEKYRRQIANSSGVAVFACAEQTKAGWIDAGRAYQRFALLSTALGLRHAFVNQPVEVPEIRPQLASYLDLGERLPDLVVRFGYGDPTPRTLRRPVRDVLAREV